MVPGPRCVRGSVMLEVTVLPQSQPRLALLVERNARMRSLTLLALAFEGRAEELEEEAAALADSSPFEATLLARDAATWAEAARAVRAEVRR